MDSNVKTLLDKAAAAKEGHIAMNFAQAALNAAHALQVLKQIEPKIAQTQYPVVQGDHPR